MNQFLHDNICGVLDGSSVALDIWNISHGLQGRGIDLSPENLTRMLVCLVDAGKIERLNHPRAIEYAAISRAQQLLSRYENTPH
jgi:hypothetical protein